MTTLKIPPNLSDPTTLLYKIYEDYKNLTHVCILMQDEEGNFKIVTNEYDPQFIAVGAVTLQGLAQELIWSNASNTDV